MAPLPKRKISKRRQGKRRAAIKLKLASLIRCPNCGFLKKSHQVCPACGQYKGRMLIVKREKKKRENIKSQN